MKLKSLIGDILLVIIGLFSIAAVSTAFYRDWMFRNGIENGIKASYEAIREGDDRKLINAVRDVEYNMGEYYDQHLFLKRSLLDKTSDYVRDLSNNPRIQDNSDFLHFLVEPLYGIARELCRTTRYRVPEYCITELVTNYNYNWKAFKNDLGDWDIEYALNKYPDSLVVYDVACRTYHNKGNAEKVISTGMRALRCKGDGQYRADILHYMQDAMKDYGTIQWEDNMVDTSYVPQEYIPFSILETTTP